MSKRECKNCEHVSDEGISSCTDCGTGKIKFVEKKVYGQEDKILYVNGSERSFHCEGCDCNVFREINKNKYKCNGCRITYTGE